MSKPTRFPTCPTWCVTDHVDTQDDGAVRVHHSQHRMVRGGGQRAMSAVRLARTDIGGEPDARVTGAVRLEVGPLAFTPADAQVLADCIREYMYMAGVTVARP